MYTTPSALAAAEHVRDLQREAARRRASAGLRASDDGLRVELRLARDFEEGAVRRLAALDDAPVLEGPVLIALVDGDAVAALSLRDQRVVANPFVPTSDTVAVLRLRAKHMTAPGRRSRLRWLRSA